MPSSPLPPEFEASRTATPDDLKSLPSISHRAAQVLERCIDQHHIAEIDYTDAGSVRSKARFRPAYIRYNRTHHVVVWGMPADGDHWEELRLDRIHGVRDTDERF